jgi:hypothetical protein
VTPAERRALRLQAIIGAVARQALGDRCCTRVAVLDDESPEAALASRWLAAELGAQQVVRVEVSDPQVESVLHLLQANFGDVLGLQNGSSGGRTAVAAEVRRLLARLHPGALAANPINKTSLLLGGDLPPEPLLPLGDLYASEIRELVGDWSAPPPVRALADLCGGVELLDGALRRYFDGREPAGLESLASDARRGVETALARGRASRLIGTVVPKLGGRTVGVDLFE